MGNSQSTQQVPPAIRRWAYVDTIDPLDLNAPVYRQHIPTLIFFRVLTTNLMQVVIRNDIRIPWGTVFNGEFGLEVKDLVRFEDLACKTRWCLTLCTNTRGEQIYFWIYGEEELINRYWTEDAAFSRAWIASNFVNANNNVVYEGRLCTGRIMKQKPTTTIPERSQMEIVPQIRAPLPSELPGSGGKRKRTLDEDDEDTQGEDYNTTKKKRVRKTNDLSREPTSLAMQQAVSFRIATQQPIPQFGDGPSRRPLSIYCCNNGQKALRGYQGPCTQLLRELCQSRMISSISSNVFERLNQQLDMLRDEGNRLVKIRRTLHGARHIYYLVMLGLRIRGHHYAVIDPNGALQSRYIDRYFEATRDSVESICEEQDQTQHMHEFVTTFMQRKPNVARKESQESAKMDEPVEMDEVEEENGGEERNAVRVEDSDIMEIDEETWKRSRGSTRRPSSISGINPVPTSHVGQRATAAGTIRQESTPGPKYVWRGCKVCGRKAEIMCQQCSAASYCSSECWALDHESHKLVCGKPSTKVPGYTGTNKKLLELLEGRNIYPSKGAKKADLIALLRKDDDERTRPRPLAPFQSQNRPIMTPPVASNHGPLSLSQPLQQQHPVYGYTGSLPLPQLRFPPPAYWRYPSTQSAPTPQLSLPHLNEDRHSKRRKVGDQHDHATSGGRGGEQDEIRESNADQLDTHDNANDDTEDEHAEDDDMKGT